MDTSLVLRNSKADGTSHDGFQWPKAGPVECPDWNPAAQCGGGLHGLLWGEGDWSRLSAAQDALWQVVEVVTESIVKIEEQKVKFPRGTVVFSGNMAGAITMVLNHEQHFKDILAEITANANKGNKSSGNYSRAASSGNSSTAASSGNSSRASAAGKDAVAMAAGNNCTVQAGENGCFSTVYFDEKAKRNRILVGYVGEDGIKPNTPYRVKVLKTKAMWEVAK